MIVHVAVSENKKITKSYLVEVPDDLSERRSPFDYAIKRLMAVNDYELSMGEPLFNPKAKLYAGPLEFVKGVMEV